VAASAARRAQYRAPPPCAAGSRAFYGRRLPSLCVARVWQPPRCKRTYNRQRRIAKWMVQYNVVKNGGVEMFNTLSGRNNYRRRPQQK